MWGILFFKQKTAYEMRIGDWSSDVCSSDLPSLVIRVLPEILRRFGEGHPQGRLSVHDVPNTDLVQLVRQGEADLGVGLASFDTDLFEQHPLFEDAMVLVCGEGHRFYDAAEVPRSEIRTEPVVTFHPTSNVHQIATRVFADLGTVFRPVGTFHYRMSVLGMVAHGLAVAILPSLSLDETIYPGLRQIPLVGPLIKRRYCLIMRRGKHLVEPARALATVLIDELSRGRAADGPRSEGRGRIGRAACRERGGQDVESSVVARALKKKKHQLTPKEHNTK